MASAMAVWVLPFQNYHRAHRPPSRMKSSVSNSGSAARASSGNSSRLADKGTWAQRILLVWHAASYASPSGSLFPLLAYIVTDSWITDLETFRYEEDMYVALLHTLLTYAVWQSILLRLMQSSITSVISFAKRRALRELASYLGRKVRTSSRLSSGSSEESVAKVTVSRLMSSVREILRIDSWSTRYLWIISCRSTIDNMLRLFLLYKYNYRQVIHYCLRWTTFQLLSTIL